MPAPSNAVDRLLAQILLNVGRPNDSNMSDYSLTFVNNTQRTVCNRINFWFMRANTTLAFAQSDLTKALPTDFKDEDIVSILESNGRTTELEMIDYEDYRKNYDDTTQAKPRYYMLDGAGNILIRPVPNTAYTVVLDYWKYLADLVAGGSSNKLLNEYPEVIETGATARAFRMLGQDQTAEIWEGRFERHISDLKYANVERELANELVIKPRADVHGSTTTRPKGRL